MTQMFLWIFNKHDDIDFFLICHAACDKIGDFQWFLADNPDDNNGQRIQGQIYESITVSSKWIKENAENKWIGCHCYLIDDEYSVLLGQLSSDILSIIRNKYNSFSSITISDNDKNFNRSYVLDDK